MIIGISNSSDSDDTKYPEDNTNNAWTTIFKKRPFDTKRKKKTLKTSETSTKIAVPKPELPKRSAPNESKLLTKSLDRNKKIFFKNYCDTS